MDSRSASWILELIRDRHAMTGAERDAINLALQYLPKDERTAGLKPCPFCHGSAEALRDESGLWYVACEDCGVQTTTEYNRSTAVFDWNRRAP